VSGDARHASGRQGLAKRWNLVLGFMLVAVILAAVVQGVDQANIEADVRTAVREAAELERAFQNFYERHGGYPSSMIAPTLDRTTLDPLRRRGYYDGQITRRLLNDRIDAYHSPSDGGPHQEYWVEMTLRSDPSIRILVVHSDDAPLGGGAWLEGVFLYRDGELDPV